MALVSPVFTKINKNTKFPNHLAREPVTIECYKINHRQIFSIKAKPGITKSLLIFVGVSVSEMCPPLAKRESASHL